MEWDNIQREGVRDETIDGCLSAWGHAIVIYIRYTRTYTFRFGVCLISIYIYTIYSIVQYSTNGIISGKSEIIGDQAARCAGNEITAKWMFVVTFT